METFLQHTNRSLTEEYLAELAWLDSASAFVASNSRVPLSTPILSRIFGKDFTTKKHRVFHVFPPRYLGNLIRLQGKKKSISAFLGADASVLSSGIQGGGGMVAELDAQVLLAGLMDVMSRPDTTGRRWVDYWALIGRGGRNDLRRSLQKDMDDLVATLFKKYNKLTPYPMEVSEFSSIDSAWARLVGILREKKDSQQLLKAIVSDYIDGAEKVLLKNKDELRWAMFEHLFSGEHARSGWDELVVNSIRIQKIHILNDSVSIADRENVRALLQKYKISGHVWPTSSGLSKYIQKMTGRNHPYER